jgi:threonine/homoserine/homoserine lactone efflux protein
MTPDVFAALLLFAFVTSITPGPNNLMLMASGVNFGFARTVPHMLGIGAGFLSLLLGVGFGLGAVLAAWPPLHMALKAAGGVYLLYLAWRIAMARTMAPAGASDAQGEGRARPMSFLEAAAFQWVNPKAWVMAVGVIATYTPQNGFFANLVIATVVCGIVNLPSIGIWVTFGTALRRVLHKPWAIRAFNVGMALLLVASLYPVALEMLH